MPLSRIVRHSLLLLTALSGCSRPAPPGNPAAPDADRITYTCESGRTVEASYPTDSTAVVHYQGETYHMALAVSASGARYAGDGMQWWTKGTGPGTTGLLSRFNGDEQVASEEVETCAEAVSGT